MYLTGLEKRLDALWESQLPFIVFRLPESQKITLFTQENDILHTTSDLSESGFVMTTFKGLEKNPIIPNSKTEYFPRPEKQLIDTIQTAFSENEKTKQQFKELVNKAKKEIAHGKLKKVVLSRPIDLKSKRKPQTLFLALENRYPNALTYLWHHPYTGTWLGATPEQFVEASSTETQTMALAGTQVFNPDEIPLWSDKEKDEQALVTEQVLLDLKTLFKDDQIQYGKPLNKRAGNLVHLCTRFTLPKLESRLMNLISALHPTPAVGGVPKKEAKEFIVKKRGV
ncbi:chorismate-binding protein [Flavobacteriaceae bacterium]|nr:chorismate-binding protein [Flavobacteriaceae bacterium]